MIRAIYELLYGLSRLPGLGFLRGIASSFYSIDRTQRQIEQVGRSAKRLKDKVSPKDQRPD